MILFWAIFIFEVLVIALLFRAYGDDIAKAISKWTERVTRMSPIQRLEYEYWYHWEKQFNGTWRD